MRVPWIVVAGFESPSDDPVVKAIYPRPDLILPECRSKRQGNQQVLWKSAKLRISDKIDTPYYRLGTAPRFREALQPRPPIFA